jgi:hypothetical protein
MTTCLASAALALLLLTACESPAPMGGSVEARQPGKRGLYDCSPTGSGTQQVIAESPEDAELLCNSPAGGR